MPTALQIKVTSASPSNVHKAIVKNGGTFEPEVVAVVTAFCEQETDPVFIDVGANIGVYPLIASLIGRDAGKTIAVHAFEPLPMLQDKARRLGADNGVDYDLRTCAVSDENGTADFYVSARSDASNSLVAGFRPAREVLRVEVARLDDQVDLVAHAGRPVLLLIDVETHEPAVLRGAQDFIAKVRPLIICEVLAGRTEVALNALVDAIGYTRYRFDGMVWRREPSIYGDSAHKHRDWIFAPPERAAQLGESWSPSPTRQIQFLT